MGDPETAGGRSPRFRAKPKATWAGEDDPSGEGSHDEGEESEGTASSRSDEDMKSRIVKLKNELQKAEEKAADKRRKKAT